MMSLPGRKSNNVWRDNGVEVSGQYTLKPRSMVIHQWPTAQAFLDWYHGPAYAPWKPKRMAAATADVILVQGLIESAPSPTVSPTSRKTARAKGWRWA